MSARTRTKTSEEPLEKEKQLRFLVVDDDFFSRRFLKDLLSPYARIDIAVNGQETLEAFKLAFNDNDPYHMICLDILMPVLNGQEALKQIRQYEKENNIHGLDGVKVIMTTGVEDHKNIMGAFKAGCEGYLKKPIDDDKLFDLLKELALIK